MSATPLPVRKPTRKEVDLYYKTNRSKFHAPERIHVLHIVRNVEGTSERDTVLSAMRRIEERLKAGEDFGALADQESDCKGNGGDLGWFPRGVMVKEFDDVVFELSPGQQSPIFESRFGLHIVRLIEKRAPGIQPLSEVYDVISNFLHRSRLEGAGH
ncbi:MAG: peptidylprolyl isomerase [Bryobacteraceae bacterium]